MLKASNKAVQSFFLLNNGYNYGFDYNYLYKCNGDYDYDHVTK